MRLAALLVALMIISLSGHASAYRPSKWPSIDHVSKVFLFPGEDEVMNFTLRNRLPIDMENATLYLDVYMRLTEEKADQIHKINSPPEIQPESDSNYSTSSGIVSQFHWSLLRSKGCSTVRFKIWTEPTTPAGVYLLRLRLEFENDGEEHQYLSRGHFTQEQYNLALNQTFDEGVDGIVPETSFEVRDRPPTEYIIYIFLGALVCFGIGAFLWWREKDN